jgi:putative tryptophan/tyrosine transport system substrate-binding protein
MRRRDFITVISGVAVTWPIAVVAQQGGAMPVVGYLGSASLESAQNQLAGFRRGLEEQAFFAGNNVLIEQRWSDGHYDRLPKLAAELAGRKLDLILGAGLPATLAAKAATAQIPIVFVMGADPVTSGIVASLNRPGGNITGISQYYGALGGKRLELLRDIVPAAGIVAVLTNTNNPNSETHLSDVENVARAKQQKIVVAAARDEAEIDAAITKFVGARADALLLADDPLFTVNRNKIIALAARFRLPAIYYTREFVSDGGLISYGSSTFENYRLAGTYAGRIMKGAKAADLPVLQPTKFELVINLKTAKALSLAVPQSLLVAADEVIE